MTNEYSKERLLKAINKYPADWTLTPVYKKMPVRQGWQDEEPIARDELYRLINEGEWLYSRKKEANWLCSYDGIGIRLGEVSSNLMAIDIDGSSAKPIFKAILGGKFPKTVTFVSGKEGRGQQLFRLSSEQNEQLKGFTRYVCGEYDGYKAAEGEQVEFRYNRCISILPPSRHPSTGLYSFPEGYSPLERKVAPIPEKLFQFILEQHQEAKREEEERMANYKPLQSVSSYSPWDSRLLAPYLDGYDPKGRAGWITAKCPCHNGNSNSSLHIKRDTGTICCQLYRDNKRDGSGCSPKNVYQAMKELAIKKGYEPAKPKPLKRKTA